MATDNRPGSLYVIEFDNGTVKVGRSTQPTVRIRQHGANADVFGIAISQTWTSDPVGNLTETEAAALDAVRPLARRVVKSEWLQGVSFDTAVKLVAIAVTETGAPVDQSDLHEPLTPRRTRVDWKKLSDENRATVEDRHNTLRSALSELVEPRKGSCVSSSRVADLVNARGLPWPTTPQEIYAVLSELYPRRNVTTRLVRHGARTFREYFPPVESASGRYRAIAGFALSS